MSKKKYFIREEIWDFGTKVRVIDESPYCWLNKYPATVVSFRWRKDGGIDYRIRAWRTNQTWVPGEQLVKVADALFCSGCMKAMNHACCGGCHG